MSTYTFNLIADNLVREALQLCGVTGLGRPVKPEYIQDGREILAAILKSLQSFGVTLTQLIPSTVTLQPNVASYVLDPSFISVESEPTTITQTSPSNTETWVDRMSYSDWRIISDKTVTGLPTRVYVQQLQSGLTAFFWSVPDVVYTWNFRGLQMLPDISNGQSGTGLTQRWMEAITFRLAYRLAFPLNVPMQRRQELNTESERLKMIAMGQESERGDLNVMLPMDPWGSWS